MSDEFEFWGKVAAIPGVRLCMSFLEETSWFLGRRMAGFPFIEIIKLSAQ